MLTNWLIPQLAAERHDYLFQQDGAPPHWHLAVRTFVNEHLPNRWIGRAGQKNQVFSKWPLRLPDLTVCDFFFWGYVNVPPLPATVDELQERITAAVNWVMPDMLQSLVRARLSHRCLPSNKRGAHWVCVIPHETVWVYASVATNFVRIFQ